MMLDDDRWGRLLFDGLPAPFFVKDLEGRLQYANRCFETWYGCPSSWQGKTVEELLPREQAERCRALDRKVLETGGLLCAEDELSDSDGSHREIQSTKFPVHDENMRVVGIGTLHTAVHAYADIAREPSSPPEAPDLDSTSADRRSDETRQLQMDLRHVASERDVARAALLDNQRHLNLITRNLPALIVHYDAQLRYMFVNETYCRWRCVEPSDVLGRTVADVASADVLATTRSAFQRALAGEQVSLEYSDEFPDGEVRDIHGLLIPEKLADDRVIGLFALGTDVSDIKRMERTLLRQTRLATLGEVVGAVAHELRTPLSTILVSTASLEQPDENASPGLARALARIERNVRRCSKIIADLLDYARIPTLSCEAVELDGFLDAELSRWTLPPEVALERDLNAKCTLSVDRRLIAQAIEKLRDNSLEAMRPGASEPPRGQLTVSTRATGDRVDIVVADTGGGIPEHAQEQVFEPLFSLGVAGVGLGLATVRQIMQEHGGGADLASSAPEGTAVVLWLPRPTQEQGG